MEDKEAYVYQTAQIRQKFQNIEDFVALIIHVYLYIHEKKSSTWLSIKSYKLTNNNITHLLIEAALNFQNSRKFYVLRFKTWSL